jgi:bacterioferritin-associated ferredoxin
MKDDMYLCMCNAVCGKELKDFLKENPQKSEDQIMENLNLSKGCGICKDHCLKEIKNYKSKNKRNKNGLEQGKPE